MLGHWHTIEGAPQYAIQYGVDWRMFMIQGNIGYVGFIIIFKNEMGFTNFVKQFQANGMEYQNPVWQTLSFIML